jgi:hypothetical protein
MTPIDFFEYALFWNLVKISREDPQKYHRGSSKVHRRSLKGPWRILKRFIEDPQKDHRGSSKRS